jgi:GNAT superfamily N-acetyltransferase
MCVGGEDELFGTMLDNLHVLQSQKGKGIGRKLVRDIASWCDRDYSAKGYTSGFLSKMFPPGTSMSVLEAVLLGKQTGLLRMVPPSRKVVMRGRTSLS